MSAMAQTGLTNCQVSRHSGEVSGWFAPGMLSRAGATLRLWRRRMQERSELARLGERELRDMRASTADVWQEVNQPFWRAAPRH